MRIAKFWIIGFILSLSNSVTWAGQIITVDALGAVRISYPSTINYEIGASVAGIGDFDGDGFRDVAIGSPSFEPPDTENEYDTGAVFVVSGSQLNLERGDLDLSRTDFRGVVVTGRFDTRIGQTVDGAGDFNGDGYSDLIIGSSRCNGGYILFGNPQSRRSIPLSDLKENGVEILHTGFSLASAGDFNGDGFPDVLFGNPEAEIKSVKQDEQEKEYESSFVTLVYGKSILPQVIDSLIPNDEFLLSIRGIVLGTRLGESVCGNLDLNADGYSDIGILAPKGGKDLRGRAYLFFGREKVDTTDHTFEIDHANRYIHSAGDVNGDGFPELLVGREDQSTLLLWGGDHLQGTMDLNQADPRWGVVLKGAASVFGVGDINGDTFADIAVGLPHDSVRDKAHAGRVVFILGTDKWPDYVDVQKLCDGELSVLEYVVVEGTQAFGAFGTSIAALGDLQKDGFDDVVIGAPFQTLPGELRLESPGAAYVIQGKSLFQCLQTRRSIMHFSFTKEKKE